MKQGYWIIPDEGGRFLPSAKWMAAAGVLLGSVFGWTVLSGFFVYGEGHTERPIIAFVALFLLAWAGYGLGLLLIRSGHSVRLHFVLLVALLARLLLLPSDLIQENDVYRYVLDGQVLLHGKNPFEYPPKDVLEHSDGALRESLERTDARLVLSRIGYPEIPTVYPPAAQMSFLAGALVGGWNWQGQRWVFLSLDLFVIGLLVVLLRILSLPPVWILFYAWNPLILKEITNSCHVDILVGVFVVGSLFCLHLSRLVAQKLFVSMGATLLGLAALSKLYPLLLLPATVLWMLRSRVRWPVIIGFCVLVTGVFVAGFFPFLGIGFERLAAGVSTYADRWIMNEGAFALLALASDKPRILTTLFIGTLGVAIPLARGSRSIVDLGNDYLLILLLWFLLIPTPFPWYATPLVCLGTLVAGRPQAIPIAVLSGTFGLYYLSFFYEYNQFTSVWWNWTRVIEHAVVWASVVLAAATAIIKER